MWNEAFHDWNAKGCIDIDGDSQIMVCSEMSVDKNSKRKKPDNRPNTFDVVTPLLPFGVRLQASSDEDMQSWVKALRQIVFKCKTATELSRLREAGKKPSKRRSLKEHSSAGEEMVTSRQETARSHSVI